MEPKKIKKLVIKKETISALNDYEQSKQKGGAETGYAMCNDYTNWCPLQTYENASCLFPTQCEGCIPVTQVTAPPGCPTPSGVQSCLGSCINC